MRPVNRFEQTIVEDIFGTFCKYNNSWHELGRVALPTVQRRLALSGKLCFNSLWPVTNVTGQGNGKRSRIVREKRAGPGITVKAKIIIN